MKKQVIFLPAILALVAGAALATPSVIYCQPPTPIWGGLESSAEPGVIIGDASWPLRRSADDFLLRFDAKVIQVRWWGHSSDRDHTTTEYNIDQVTGFLIEFFEKDPTTTGVGASIYSEVFAVHATAPLMTSYDAYDASPVFVHSASLSSAVALSAHKTYWLSIAAYRKDEPRWVWFRTSRGNHFYDMDIEVDGKWDGPYVCSDVAFELVVPEPATVVVFALSGLALLWMRKV